VSPEHLDAYSDAWCYLHNRTSQGKGRGVFARRLITTARVSSEWPVLVLPVSETRTASGPTRMSGILLSSGVGGRWRWLWLRSLYNHSYQPNARYDDESGQSKVFQGDPGYRTGRGDRGQLQTESRGTRRQSGSRSWRASHSRRSQNAQKHSPAANDKTPTETHIGISRSLNPHLPVGGETDGRGTGRQVRR